MVQIPKGCKLDVVLIEFKGLVRPRAFYMVRLLDTFDGQEYFRPVPVRFGFALALRLKIALRICLRMRKKLAKFQSSL